MTFRLSEVRNSEFEMSSVANGSIIKLRVPLIVENNPESNEKTEGSQDGVI